MPAVVLIVVVCVVGVGLAYRGGPIGADQAVMKWFIGIRGDALTPVVSAVSDLFSPAMVALWTLAVAVGLMMRDRTIGRAAAVITGVAAAGAVTEVVKLIVARPRPPMAYHEGISEMTYSYPSGHVTGVAALALTTTAVAANCVVRRRLIVAVAVSVVAAATRLYLGVHWTSDVLAGFAVAAAAALVAPVMSDAVLIELRRRAGGRLPDWVSITPKSSVKCVEIASHSEITSG